MDFCILVCILQHCTFIGSICSCVNPLRFHVFCNYNLFLLPFQFSYLSSFLPSLSLFVLLLTPFSFFSFLSSFLLPHPFLPFPAFLPPSLFFFSFFPVFFHFSLYLSLPSFLHSFIFFFFISLLSLFLCLNPPTQC